MPATKLYLRNLTAADPPSAGEKSTALPVDTLGANNATGTDETRALNTAPGSAQTSLAKNSDASTAARDNYLARFTSAALAAQTIAAQTWTFALALNEANTNANSFLIASLYVWRPSTSAVVGFIYDSHTSLGVEWGATEDGQVVTVSGSAVTTQAGDVLVFEVWRHAAQGMANAYAQTLYFDGTTDVVDSTTTDAASYISDTNGLTFAGAAQTATPSPVVVAMSVVVPLIVAGAVALTPSPVAASFAVPSPTIVIGVVTVTPGAVVVAFTITAPTLVPGGVTVTPLPVAASFTAPAPTVASGVVVLTPSPVAASFTTPSPTLLTGGTVAPPPVVASFVTTDPTLLAGGVSVVPDPVVASFTAAAPNVLIGGLTLTPSPVSAAFVVVTPSVVVGPVIVTPDPALATFTAPSPTIGIGAVSVSPTPAVAAFSVPAPVVIIPFVIADGPMRATGTSEARTATGTSEARTATGTSPKRTAN